jgi:hypothetical protein
MKRQITAYLIVAVCIMVLNSIAFAQNQPIDFEPGGYGADWTWTVFENDTNPPLEIVGNPDVSEPNISATVAKFTALQTGEPWAGCESLHGSDIGTFTLDETNCTVKIMVYKTVLSDVGIKFVKPDGWSMGEIKVANTVINEWEELTFDFSSQMSEGYDQIVIFPDFDLAGREQDNIIYFDNITFSPQGTYSEPTVAAPTPVHDEEDDNVFSIYSDSYTDLDNTNFNPNWGQATIVTYETIEGNNTLKHSNLNYQGTNLGSAEGTPQDVSGHLYFHVDFWTPNATTLNFFLISQSSGEVFYPLPITLEQWVSVDIPLSYFSDQGLDLTDIFQFKVDSGGGTSTIVWFDNWYFHVGSSGIFDEQHVGTIPSASALSQNYPNPFNPSTTIQFELPENSFAQLTVYDISGKLVKTIVNEEKETGYHSVVWDGKDEHGISVESGIYIYRLTTSDGINKTNRMTLLK